MNARVARCHRDHVYPDDYDYNFVIPKSLVIKLDAVVGSEKKKRPKSKYFNPIVDGEYPEGTAKEILTYFPGETPKFTSEAIYSMHEFYSTVNKFNAWKADVEWLTSTNWDDMSVNPKLSYAETDSDDLSSDNTGEKRKALANEVVKQLEGACLNSSYRLSSGVGIVKLEGMVGMIARDRMLSDTIVNFSITCICDALEDCYALDSFAVTLCCPDPPMT
ncbi:hypothetical protein ON010_g19047 [Phytophthora cinnamomi]|nr:hypothetical protein ON010_g19047 [Phytophthora cinnamomi]